MPPEVARPVAGNGKRGGAQASVLASILDSTYTGRNNRFVFIGSQFTARFTG